MSKGTKETLFEYALTCSCGKGQRLELTEREQYNGDLNESTQIIANLFEYFHAQHGTVEGGFALKEKPMPTRELLEKIEALKTENTKLRAALEQVEWRASGAHLICLWCHGDREYGGHKPDCARQAALASPDARPAHAGAAESKVKSLETKLNAEIAEHTREVLHHAVTKTRLDTAEAQLAAAETALADRIRHCERYHGAQAEAREATLRALAVRLWGKVNEWRCRLIQWKIAGDASARDLAELAELQALADEHMSVMAPLPIKELEAYMREHGIEIPDTRQEGGVSE